MTAADRQRIRAARDAHLRAEMAHILNVRLGQGRCRECLSLYEEFSPGCGTCRDRERLRAKRAAA